MSEEKLVVDLKEMTCGLVPAMVKYLETATVDVVEIHIRSGIQTEMLNSFGTGGDWEISMREDLFFDIARFTRVEKKSLDPLGLLEF